MILTPFAAGLLIRFLETPTEAEGTVKAQWIANSLAQDEKGEKNATKDGKPGNATLAEL